MRLVVGGRPAAVERAFASPETWVPLLAWPVTAAEQGPPSVWALITFRVKGEGLALINIRVMPTISQAL